MRRIAYLRWLAPVLAAFLVAGCGVLTSPKLKPQTKTLSHARLVYIANQACRRFERRVTRHGKAKSPEAALSAVEKLYVPAYEHLLFKLRGLVPPTSDAVAFRRMLATLNEEDLVLHNFLQAAEESQIQRVRTLLKRIDRLGRRLNARAAKVGLHTCAKG